MMVVLNLGTVGVYTPAPRGDLRLSTHGDRADETVSGLLRLRSQEGVILEISRDA